MIILNKDIKSNFFEIAAIHVINSFRVSIRFSCQTNSFDLNYLNLVRLDASLKKLLTKKVVKLLMGYPVELPLIKAG